MSEEEKKAIELLKKLQKKTPYIIWGDGTPYNKSNQIQTILNVIDRQQKEINFYKNEELTYIAGYEDGKRHKQTAVMIKKENEQQELFEKEIVRLKKIIEKQQKEIEELKSIASEFTNRNIEQFSIGEFNFKVKHFKDNYIHKDKIRELKEKVEKEMISNPYDFSYMINELLEENKMELSEEEKKAIETLKEVASDDFDTLGDDISPKMAQNILNLINKQQKEIEELKQNIIVI